MRVVCGHTSERTHMHDENVEEKGGSARVVAHGTTSHPHTLTHTHTHTPGIDGLTDG